MYKKASLIIIFILLLISGFFLIRPHSRLLLAILPPKNLYKPIVKESITLDKKGSVHNLQISHEYSGTYIVGVYLERQPAYGVPVTIDAWLDLELWNNENVFYKNNYTNWSSRFGGPGEKESGVIFDSYDVPGDVPLGQRIHATLNIENPDLLYKAKYGELVFFIKRKSDQ